MRRRTFLRLSALSAAAFSVPFIQSCNAKTLNAAAAQPLFLSHIFDAKIMKDVGLAYTKQMPAEDSKSKLAGLLADSAIAETTDANTVRTFYDKKTRDDFAALKTVVVNGWVLGITEARQCALFSLNQN